MSNFEDVKAFHKKFGLMNYSYPGHLSERKIKERVEFLEEELTEFKEAKDLESQADALIDLVYVAMGTAVMMGLPWQSLWSDVQRANMSKVRGVTHRGHPVDVSKPDGWQGPKTELILREYGYTKQMVKDYRDDL